MIIDNLFNYRKYFIGLLKVLSIERVVIISIAQLIMVLIVFHNELELMLLGC